jgi:dTDP-4-amino-4,6-dideoxygalactose transaminase
MMNAHQVTAEFEKALCEYTGAPYAVAVDNCSNALFLALYYEVHVRFGGPGKAIITIPSHTYPAVACEVMHAGGIIEFWNNGSKRKGQYRLIPTRVWDSALTFTAGMFMAGQIQCLSFTGPYKHLKLGKGGAILTDDEQAYKWFKKARFSGRAECSYHEDNFDDNPVIGWNFYMPIETAARGLHMMQQFYVDGKPISNEDICLPYPDLSKFKLWQ